jgi:N-acetyl-anhydromuramyl-L-alanine amidase AmpD
MCDVIPEDWMPDAKMQRIICHWTAGAHKASDFDRGHYHILIENDGKLVRGTPSIKLNEAPVKQGYAAHTLNCNSGSIGISLCCMAGAVEAPFKPGSYPMTQEQWDAMTSVVAELSKKYSIPITEKTVLSHAEVQGNLGIRQRGKWDFTRLAFDLSVKGAKACGDKLRAEAKAKL